MIFWLTDGVKFECTRCDWCCTQPGGFVHGSEQDFRNMAAALDLDFKTFVLNYCVDHEGFLSLKSKPEGPCILYNNGCTVYEQRPTQCRTFPFWPGYLASKKDWQRISKQCEGIGRGKTWSPWELRQELNRNDVELFRTPKWALQIWRDVD